MTTRLFLSSALVEQAERVVLPWFKLKRPFSARLNVVLTPSRAEGFYWRRELAQQRINLVGIRFWTPSDLRSFLMERLHPPFAIASAAELQLITRLTADEQGKSNEEASPTLRSIAQDPGPFLSSFDTLIAAGWNPEEHGTPFFQDLASALQRALPRIDRVTQAQAHRFFWNTVQSDRLPELAHVDRPSLFSLPCFSNLLLVGFNATHWPLWDLLKAAVAASENTTLSLLAPRAFGEESDQLWINSWEQLTGTCWENPDDETPKDDVTEFPFAPLVAAVERGDRNLPHQKSALSERITFCMGNTLAVMARRLVQQVLVYLEDTSCTRLGLVFPEPNALALAVRAEIEKLKIPFLDGIGCLNPGVLQSPSWLSWLNLQQEPTIPHFLTWRRACEGDLIREDERILRRIESDLLLDRLETAVYALEKKSHPPERLISDLKEVINWPETAPLFEWRDLLFKKLAKLGWTELVEALEVPDWPVRNEAPPSPESNPNLLISRSVFFQMLQELSQRPDRHHSEAGHYFYGKVHLVIAPHMTGQRWSHLILTGLNQGVWPRDLEMNPFASHHDRVLFNQRARQLNQQSLGSGSHGEGQMLLKNARGYLLTGLDKYMLSLRDACQAIDGTSSRLTLAAMENQGSSTGIPSDLLCQIYALVTGEPLTDATMGRLSEETAAVVEKNPIPQLDPPHEKRDLFTSEALHAHAIRRQGSLPFGPYEFAFESPPEFPIQLGAKDWQYALSHPSSLWLQQLVGVEAWPDNQMDWRPKMGVWIHRWLEVATKFVVRSRSRLTTPSDFSNTMRIELEKLSLNARNDVEAMLRETRQPMPFWWLHLWTQSRSLAFKLGAKIAPFLQTWEAWPEYKIAREREILVALRPGDAATFNLHGNVDLILLMPNESASLGLDEDGRPMGLDLTSCALHIFDYKTGSSDEKISLSSLKKGAGWQLVFYGWAFQNLGVHDIKLSILMPDSSKDIPFLKLETALEETTAREQLALHHLQGIFGQKPQPDAEFSFGMALPLATLPIPPRILEEKWKATRGSVETWGEIE